MPSDAVPDELAFRFQHGAIARSLPEFRDALRDASASTVWFHREHYVPWVRDVLRDAALARRLADYAGSGAAPDVYREIVLDLVARKCDAARAPS